MTKRIPALAAGRRRLEGLVASIARPRGPVEGDLRLTRRNVFVLPTRAGLLYAAALATMLVASINYALSLGFMLTFLLGAVALVSMLQTFRNIVSLVLRPGRCEPVFAGQPAELNLLVANRGTLERFALRVSIPDATSAENLDLAPASDQPVRLAMPTRRRGWMQVPRITVETEFPLGLWRAWTWWQPAMRVLVYPAPESGAVPPPPADPMRGGGTGGARGDDDLSAIRPYRAGDLPRSIAWRAMASTASEALLSKQFEGGAAGDLHLDWNALAPALGTEARVSRLARWVLDAHEAEARWSLAIPGCELGPDRGAAHRDRCLAALAVMDGVGP